MPSIARARTHFPRDGKELRVVDVADRIQVRARRGVVPAVGARPNQPHGNRQVVRRETPGVGEHRHLAFRIAPGSAGLRQFQELRGRGRMRAGTTEIAPLDPGARQALLQGGVCRRSCRRLLEHRDRVVAATRREQGIGKLAQLAGDGSARAGRDGLARGVQTGVEIGGVQAADAHEDFGGASRIAPRLAKVRPAPTATAGRRPPRPAPKRPPRPAAARARGLA